MDESTLNNKRILAVDDEPDVLDTIEELLEEYETLERCIENNDQMKGKRLLNAFENHLEDALLSKDLVKIVTDIDLGHTREDTNYSFYPNKELIGFMEKLNFKSFIRKLKDMKFDEHQANAGDENHSFVNLSEEKIQKI